MSAATATRPPRRPRVASPERWQQALDRAMTAGLTAATVAGDPRHWFVASASRPGVGYLVGVTPDLPPSCLCDAGLHGDPVCQHRALILDRLGLLPRPPAPPALSGQDDPTPRAPFAPRIVERPKSPAVRAALAALYGDDAA